MGVRRRLGQGMDPRIGHAVCLGQQPGVLHTLLVAVEAATGSAGPRAPGMLDVGFTRCGPATKTSDERCDGRGRAAQRTFRFGRCPRRSLLPFLRSAVWTHEDGRSSSPDRGRICLRRRIRLVEGILNAKAAIACAGQLTLLPRCEPTVLGAATHPAAIVDAPGIDDHGSTWPCTCSHCEDDPGHQTHDIQDTHWRPPGEMLLLLDSIHSP